MSDLRVDTTALRHASTRLRQAAEFAGTARDRGSWLRELAPSVGGDAARATDRFLREWSYGLDILGKDAEGLATALDGAATAYEAVETGLGGGLP